MSFCNCLISLHLIFYRCMYVVECYLSVWFRILLHPHVESCPNIFIHHIFFTLSSVYRHSFTFLNILAAMNIAAMVIDKKSSLLKFFFQFFWASVIICGSSRQCGNFIGSSLRNYHNVYNNDLIVWHSINGVRKASISQNFHQEFYFILLFLLKIYL